MKTAPTGTKRGYPASQPDKSNYLPTLKHSSAHCTTHFAFLRQAILLAACLLVVGWVFIISAPPVRAQTDADAVQQLSGAAQEIVAAINQHRVNAGLNALGVNPFLNQAAQGHANDMMVNYNYTHRGSDGSTVKMRVARTGYSADPWVSENWVSSRSVDGAMRWWMNDYIHRVNILTGRWQEIGVGIATRPNTGEMIFVTVFSAGGGDGSGQPSIVPAAQPAPAAAPAPASAPLPTVDVPPGGMDYTIRPGDTLLGIAIRHSLDWRVVAAGNGLGEQSILQIGQVIRLPGVDSAPAGQFGDDATTGSTASTEDESRSAAPPVETEPYTVQSGDTLFSIAARKGITWQELAALNNFREQDYLQIGQSMKVPKRQPTVQAAGTQAVAVEAAVEAEAGADAGFSGEAASVTQETDPDKLAQLLADIPVVTASELNQASAPLNGTQANYVTREHTPIVMLAPAAPASEFNQASGQAVSAEPAAVAMAAAVPTGTNNAETAAIAPAGSGTYIVQPGDTIISIAIRHNIDWQSLLALNGLTEQSLLQLGQEIRLR